MSRGPGANDNAAQACLERALAVARAREARSWELRAAPDLARLWASRGVRSRASDLLAPVVAWFDPGLGSSDLVVARQLLEELEEGPRPAAEETIS